MNPQPSSNESLVISYLILRRAIGIIGIALPPVLALGNIILEFPSPKIQSSISSYYYTIMGDVFVGSLCAIGVFLWSYRGYERIDSIAGDIAGTFALGVALFPTKPEYGVTPQDETVGALHLISAACFFLTLAFFSLYLFRKTDPKKTPTPRKRQRNVIYTICGYTIVACIALIVFVKLMPDSPLVEKLDPIFWLESLAIWAFGVSWLIKGKTILTDQEREKPVPKPKRGKHKPLPKKAIRPTR